MNCPNCGTPAPENEKFCRSCGIPLTENATENATADATPDTTANTAANAADVSAQPFQAAPNPVPPVMPQYQYVPQPVVAPVVTPPLTSVVDKKTWFANYRSKPANGVYIASKIVSIICACICALIFFISLVGGAENAAVKAYAYDKYTDNKQSGLADDNTEFDTEYYVTQEEVEEYMENNPYGDYDYSYNDSYDNSYDSYDNSYDYSYNDSYDALEEIADELEDDYDSYRHNRRDDYQVLAVLSAICLGFFVSFLFVGCFTKNIVFSIITVAAAFTMIIVSAAAVEELSVFLIVGLIYAIIGGVAQIIFNAVINSEYKKAIASLQQPY